MHPLQSEFGEELAGRRVLVTGAAGFVGWHLCRALVELKAQVWGLDRQAADTPADCAPLTTDLQNLDAVRDAVNRCRPDAVFHLAGYVNARQEMDLVLPMLQNNLVGTINLLLATTGTDCRRLVVAGSSEEISGSSQGGLPTSPYAAAKSATNAYARMFHLLYALPVVVARPFVCYGPRQNMHKVIPYSILALLRGENPQIGSGDRVCDFVYVSDVVRGMIRAGIHPGLPGKIVDLGTGKATTLREALELVAELVGGPGRPVFASVPGRIAEHPQVADRPTGRALMPWDPVWSLTEGLTETIAWYRSADEDRRPGERRLKT